MHRPIRPCVSAATITYARAWTAVTLDVLPGVADRVQELFHHGVLTVVLEAITSSLNYHLLICTISTQLWIG
jgi:hypothetical protein